ncbi:MAG TPA: DUF3348 family protein [Dongiaceae bacterium]|nr:DUF3348 family protein [Dongiaceae bacterium]
MTHASSPAPRQHSRLIRFLSDLAVADIEATHRDFADRLGQLLDFGDSIVLADALKQRRTWVAAPDTTPAATVRAEFLSMQERLVSTVVNSCTPGLDSPRVRWPALARNEARTDTPPAGFEPYRRFYVALQRDLDASIRNLRTTVRDAMSGLSEQLSQLAALDIALEDTLWDHTRAFFAVIPAFLEKRFEHLFGGESSVFPPNGLEQFRRECQGLLLAELEVRLQPALGLLEALEASEKVEAFAEVEASEELHAESPAIDTLNQKETHSS